MAHTHAPALADCRYARVLARCSILLAAVASIIVAPLQLPARPLDHQVATGVRPAPASTPALMPADPLDRLSHFWVSRDYPATDLTHLVLVGDVTGDGAPDLVSVGDLGAEVWPNDGNGFFSAPHLVTPMRIPDAWALLDVDGDGRLDLVTADSSAGGQVTWWRGVGDGHFEPTTTPLDDVPIAYLAALDVDGDGHLDLIGGESRSGQPIHIWLTRPGGRFERITGPPIGGIAQSFAIADFDRDGHPDIAWVGLFDAGVMLSDGRGGYGVVAALLIGDRLIVVPFDTNGDKIPDLVTGSGWSSIRMVTNAGDGRGWSDPVDGPFSLATVGLADLRGDGRPLLCVVDGGLEGRWMETFDPGMTPGDPRASLFRYPSPPYSYSSVLYGPSQSIAADLDGDGRDDLVTPDPTEHRYACCNPGIVHVTVTRPDGTPGEVRFLPIEVGLRGFAAAHLHNKRSDTLVLWDATTVYLTDLDPSGVLTPFRTVAHGGPVRALDLDGDHRDELLVSVPHDSLAIVRLNPNGLPVGRVETLPGRVIDARDVDGDGRPELLLAGKDGDLSIAWNSAGQFKRITATGLHVPANGTVVMADPEGTGKVELVRIASEYDCSECGPATDTLTVYELMPDGQAIRGVQSLVPGATFKAFLHAAVARLDALPGDDLVIQYNGGDEGGGELHVFHPTGGGRYVPDDHVFLFGKDGANPVVIGDWDGDGYLDAATTSNPEGMDSMIQFCWNDGHGSLLPAGGVGQVDPTSIWLGPGGAGGPIAMDLDGDGSMDLVFGSAPRVDGDYDAPPKIGVLFGRPIKVPANRRPARTEPRLTRLSPASGGLRFTRIAPNPVLGILTASFTTEAASEPITVELLDLAGRRVARDVLAPGTAGEATWSYNTHGLLAPGIYWLRLTQAGKSVSSRVAVVR